MTAHALHSLDPRDNVAVALRDIAPGEDADLDAGGSIVAVDAIGSGHKIALRLIAAGEPVLKYGHVIGQATADISPGQHVHSHNLAFVPLPPGGAVDESADAEGAVDESADAQGADDESADAQGADESSDAQGAASRGAARAEAKPSEQGASETTPSEPGASEQAVSEQGESGGTQLPERRTFMGIRRSDGRVATRNYLAIVSTVNCSATVCKAIAARAEASGLLEEFPTIDGVVAVTHDQGCGHGGPAGIETLKRTLGGYASHENVGGVVLIGLGCEMNVLENLLEGITFRPEVPFARFTIQDVGGTKAAVARGLEELSAMAPRVADVRREEVGVSELIVGLNCGGSDGWSSVTANPALGWASDAIAAQGGRTVLAETPEIYGAEDLLLKRAVTPEVADALVAKLRWWEEYTAAAGGSMDNNPSPGNKAGGITTILEKSLGSAAKGGHAPLQAVYGYAEPITARGFSFMDTPGYDPVSVTGLIAGGCNLVVFTTGRGSAIGTRPAPTLKLATNSDIFRRMSGDMDIDTGDIVEKGVPIEAKGLEIYHAILDVASGKQTHSEELGYGENEFVPWHLGAVT